MNGTSASSLAVVIDANVAIWAVVPVLSQSSIDVMARLEGWINARVKLFAPEHWLAECTSTIRRGVYARILTAELGHRAIHTLFDLRVEVVSSDEALAHAALDWAARLQQIRAYDSYYLALADILAVDLWTADKRLVNSAHQARATNVRWIEEE